MKKLQLSYSKVERNKEMLPSRVAPSASIDGNVQLITEIKLPLPQYTKEDGKLSVNLVVVISGGTTREKAFLTSLTKSKDNPFKERLVLYFISSPDGQGGLPPFRMLEKYERLVQGTPEVINGRNVILDNADSVYMISDVDHFTEDLRNCLRKDYSVEKVAPTWIISNPDFEVWLYYCFYDNPQEDLKEVLESDFLKRSHCMKVVNSRFNNGGGIDPRKAFESIETGIRNSALHYEEDEYHIPTLLSTQMHIFAEEILSCIASEFEAWKKKKEASRLLYQK